MVEAVMKLMMCNNNIGARAWEEAVRARRMDMQKCKEARELEKCVYDAYQDPVAEYIKHLICDARKLCADFPDDKTDAWGKLILVLAITLVIVLTAVAVVYVVHKKKLELITIAIDRCEQFAPCEECSC